MRTIDFEINPRLKLKLFWDHGIQESWLVETPDQSVDYPSQAQVIAKLDSNDIEALIDILTSTDAELVPDLAGPDLQDDDEVQVPVADFAEEPCEL